MNNDSDDEPEYLFTVYNMPNSQKENVVKNNEKESFVTTVKIENQTVTVLVDTGVSINVMNTKHFNEINKVSGNKTTLGKAKVIIKHSEIELL